MKRGMVAAAVAIVGLAACSKADQGPSMEQVAKGYEQYLNANLLAELGQRVEVRGWEDLNADCNPSGPERTACVTGGTLDVIGFQGGSQLQEAPAPVPGRRPTLARGVLGGRERGCLGTLLCSSRADPEGAVGLPGAARHVGRVPAIRHSTAPPVALKQRAPPGGAPLVSGGILQ